MKRILTLSLSILILFSFIGCTKLEISNLENFRKETCSVSLSEYLFPHNDYLSLFEYGDGDYHYLDTGDIAWGYVEAFAYLSYEPEIYEEAKKYCLDHFDLCDNHEYEYDEYRFHEHLCHKTKDENGNLDVGCAFPRHFNMFGFHDDSCTLFFLGYYNGDPESTEKELAQTDFGAFLKAVYAEYYDFSK